MLKISEEQNKLRLNLSQLHTTPMGAERIRRNLSLAAEDVVEWCRDMIQNPATQIERKGKNWYAQNEKCILTVNAYSYTIITAHMRKK